MSDVANTKEGFVRWLSSRNESNDTINEHVVNLETISSCYALYLGSSFDIWEVVSPKKIDAILNAANSSKKAKAIFSNFSKPSLFTLKKYLIEVVNSANETHIEWRTQSSVDNEIDFRNKLDSATKYLESKYNGVSVPTLRQLQNENSLINFGYFNIWTQQLYGKTAGQYLIEKGILCAKELDTRASSERLSDYTNTLKQRYGNKKAITLAQVISENPDIPFSMINLWTRELFNKSAKDYLIEKGIITPIPKGAVTINNSKQSQSAVISQDSESFHQISIHKGKKITAYYYDELRIIDAYPNRKGSFTIYIHERMPISLDIIQKFKLKNNPNYSEKDKYKLKGILSKESIIQLINEAYSIANENRDNCEELTKPSSTNKEADLSSLTMNEESQKPKNISYPDEKDNQSLTYFMSSLELIVNWLENRYSVNLAYNYLSDPNQSRNDMLYKVYYKNTDVMWVYMIFSKRSHYISLETDPAYLSNLNIDELYCDKSLIRESRPCLKLFYTRFDKIESSLSRICNEIELSFKENAKPHEASSSNTNVVDDTPSIQASTDSSFKARVENCVLSSDLNGITPDDLSHIIPSSSILSIKRVRDLSNKIIDLNGVMVHVDALVDLEAAANKIHEIIEKLLYKNNGYISSSQLFEYVRAELQMFLNDNDLCDEQKVFDISKFLFSKICWHGYHYEFTSGKHISNVGEAALKTNLDIFEKYARDMGGVFQWDDFILYLEKVGIKTGNLRMQMKIGMEPIFFYITSGKLITVESMNIDDEWLNKVKHALQVLFNDIGDHIVIRNIASFWYDQLPELPQRNRWTPLLLQYVLQFYGDKLGARTIHSELTTQYDSIHSLLVKKDSELQSFGDAVISFVIDNGIEGRHFQAEDFRRMLAYGKLIGNFENINNMQRAIGNDVRFAWNATGDELTILL